MRALFASYAEGFAHAAFADVHKFASLCFALLECIAAEHGAHSQRDAFAFVVAVVVDFFPHQSVGAEVVFAFGFGFCRAGNQSAQDGRACVVDAVAVVSGIEAANPAGFVLAAVCQRGVLFVAARQRLDAVVAAFLYAPHRVALAAVDVDGFFVRVNAGVLVVQVHRHAVAIEDVATERVLSALVVHCPLRAVDF